MTIKLVEWRLSDQQLQQSLMHKAVLVKTYSIESC
jgi:hypothetical protein